MRKFLFFPTEVSMLITHPVNPFLKPLRETERFKIPACNGKMTFFQSRGVFMNQSIFYHGDKAGKETPETTVWPYEFSTMTTFKPVFDAFQIEIDSVCLTQHQIIEFVKRNFDLLLVTTIFPFNQEGKYLLAHVKATHPNRLPSLEILSYSPDVLWGFRNQLVLSDFNEKNESRIFNPLPV